MAERPPTRSRKRPRLNRAWRGLFISYATMSRLYQMLARLLEIQPQSAEVNFLYGATLLNMEKPDAAVSYLQAALKQSPQMRAAEAALGQALLRCGKPEQAIPYLQAALAEDTDGDTHFQLFRALQLTGKTDLAKQAFADYQQFRASLSQKERKEQLEAITAP